MPRKASAKSTASSSPSPAAPTTPTGSRVRLGFVSLIDAAPLVVAHEYGLFRQQGLDVQLRRELGWATIRDKIAFGELEAAQAISSLLISTRLGLGGAAPTDCLTAFVLSTGGNAITLANRWWERGVRDAASFREQIVASRHEHQVVLGAPGLHSTHYLHLCDWLASGDINPRRDVRIVTVPPPQVFRNLSAGTIDGYCVGEPWNTLAVQAGIGWCPTTSAELHPGEPEKVLMVRSEFAQSRHDEHMRLLAALAAACTQCEDPAFRPELIKLLARREYLNQPARAVAASLAGPMDLGQGRSASLETFLSFGVGERSAPDPRWADSLLERIKRHGLLPPGTTIPPHFARSLFRRDLHQQAMRRAAASAA
ncbi:CmpA/NrtA family ABC transporter substrate-binding protein [Actomonas aquatica]|uniref:CmpA/NrtA family ABC transporter substrate-binding protein n=1 Tax=Actomonas aquatica TaxID=2866162 RepID=A0ABZ1CBJ4_9BACT|nr:CmpA/NrtA family ABC transporter substrate-binding protein [Opitutus sp. WL0086]WRQ89020.1 CmpA/NrtA family ABC transporter substrate-binding protein [Opitutus sp. WL0086]